MTHSEKKRGRPMFSPLQKIIFFKVLVMKTRTSGIISYPKFFFFTFRYFNNVNCIMEIGMYFIDLKKEYHKNFSLE